LAASFLALEVLQYILLFVCLACTRCLHVVGVRGITRKHRNPEVSRSRRKVFVVVATQKQYWWDT